MIPRRDREGSGAARRAIVAPEASCPVELSEARIWIMSRQPVNRARAVQNAKSTFRTSSLHALVNARAHAPQAYSFVS